MKPLVMKPLVSTRSRWLAAVCCAGCTCLGASANAQEEHAHAHADILLGSQDGQIVTLAETGPEIFEISRVFEAELPDSYFTDDPGFNNDEGEEFPAGIGALIANEAVSFDFVAMALPNQTPSNLLFWDGTGVAPSFAAISDGTTFNASTPTGPFSFDVATADGGSSDVAGFDIDTTSAVGTIHKHINFFLLDSSSETANIADGIYLVGLRLAQAGLSSSDPFYLVFATEGIDEEIHEAAVGFVETVLIPEPTTAGLLAVGGWLIARRRRRLV